MESLWRSLGLSVLIPRDPHGLLLGLAASRGVTGEYILVERADSAGEEEDGHDGVDGDDECCHDCSFLGGPIIGRVNCAIGKNLEDV